jgi:hypothetical protein
MFTSRQILLFSITISLALISAIPISINMKYHAKKFSYVDPTVFHRLDLKPSKIISIKDLANFNVVTSDSSRLEVAESIYGSTKVNNAGDTLQITNTINSKNDTSRIILYLPKGAQILADHSTLTLKGAFQREPLPDYTIVLAASKLSIPKFTYRLFINKLTVSSNDSSKLFIAGNNNIMELNLSNVLIAEIASGTVWKYKANFNEKRIVELNFDGDNYHIESKK